MAEGEGAVCLLAHRRNISETIPCNRPSLCLCQVDAKEIADMLETVVILLVVLWVVGLVSSHTMGGLIHLLLVIAIVVILVRVIQGRRI